MFFNCVDCIFATNSSLQAEYHIEEFPDHSIVAEDDSEVYD